MVCGGKSLSVHTIKTTRRELFYWSTILFAFTFTLGTAGGDLLSEGAHLGYLYSGLLFAGSIALVTRLNYKFGLSDIPALWIAYIRPGRSAHRLATCRPSPRRTAVSAWERS
jgi:uncharacterized membrane-anchored protein